MRYVNLEANMPLNTLVNRLKKAEHYNDEEPFGYWSIETFEGKEPGVHVSYNEEKKKLCTYYISGNEQKDFITSINNVFTGKIIEKDGLCFIKGFTFMSAIFNIVVILSIVSLLLMFWFMNKNPNIMIIGVIFFIYFLFVKEHYKENGRKIIYFFGECTQKKQKKINPNKKKGKYARRR